MAKILMQFNILLLNICYILRSQEHSKLLLRCHIFTKILERKIYFNVIIINVKIINKLSFKFFYTFCIFFLQNLSRVQSIRHLLLGRNIISPWWRDKVLRAVLLTGVAALAVYGRWKFMGNCMPVFSR